MAAEPPNPRLFFLTKNRVKGSNKACDSTAGSSRGTAFARRRRSPSPNSLHPLSVEDSSTPPVAANFGHVPKEDETIMVHITAASPDLPDRRRDHRDFGAIAVPNFLKPNAQQCAVAQRPAHAPTGVPIQPYRGTDAYPSISGR
jgi:hypothetical protein